MHTSEAVSIPMFGSHNNIHQQQIVAPTEVKFKDEWRRFKRCANIRAGDRAVQGFQCCEPSLHRLLLKKNSTVIEEGEIVLLVAMNKIRD